MNIGRYIRAAFTNRWNVLAFLGAGVFALLSGYADILIPLVLAGELLYLGLLGTHPKFQSHVDAQAAKRARAEQSVTAGAMLQRMLAALPAKSLKRFEALRSQCLELREIALELREPGPKETHTPLEDLQLAGLDRLLWIYLRLLFTQYSLDRFLQKTSEDEIRRDIDRLQARIEHAGPRPSDPQQLKIRKALDDNLETCRARLANFQKARDNNELVQLEIDRLENKIRTLSELAVNRQEPEFISSQVDEVASSMVQTERTMNELEFATGLEVHDQTVPQLVERQAVAASQ